MLNPVLIYIHHHHHVVPPARISLTLSRHFSQSFIASGRSSGLHPVSSHSCCMYVRAGRPAFAWPYAGVHRSTSLMSSSLLLHQCPACLVLGDHSRGCPKGSPFNSNYMGGVGEDATPSPEYIYMYIWFINKYFVGYILNKTELICLHTVKLFQVLLSNSNNSI